MSTGCESESEISSLNGRGTLLWQATGWRDTMPRFRPLIVSESSSSPTRRRASSFASSFVGMFLHFFLCKTKYFQVVQGGVVSSTRTNNKTTKRFMSSCETVSCVSSRLVSNGTRFCHNFTQKEAKLLTKLPTIGTEESSHSLTTSHTYPPPCLGVPPLS